MIEQIKNLPANVVGFRGTITKEEYDRVLIPAIDRLAAQTGKINYLFVLDTDVSNISAGAWYDDLKVGMSHLSQWRKIAIVSNQPNVNRFTGIVGHVLPGEVKTFTLQELAAAEKWVAQ